MVQKLNPLRQHLVQRSILFVLEDVQEICQRPDQDQFGMSSLQVVLVQGSVLIG
jgi:hypothetical protein